MSYTEVESFDYMEKVDSLKRVTHAVKDLCHADQFQTGLTGRMTDKQIREIEEQIQKRFRVMSAMHVEIVEMKKKKQELLNQ